MTALERATKFMAGLYPARLLDLNLSRREAAILTLASIFDSLEQLAYERGVKDGQALAGLNQLTKGE